ncbi:glycosyltransferase family 1 protein [Roseomonas sp. NAR14]|uniref:Glycosyltransferase family 1 protein n=1 Tax=Roseomonas acroporae TaxID=2937791 RepID=A0A9X1YAF7_9PROT|nr:glycosyltransferase family 1 protein [Roseomonas acroporae]
MLIVSDAWEPQVNGVVRTLRSTAAALRARGHAVEVIGPDRFRSLPCPTYPEIRLALRPRRALARMIGDFAPDALHIATEGPLGWSARRWAMARGLRFTTAFHTLFPEYLHARTGLPPRHAYAVLRRFHGASAGTMVATPALRDMLAARGFDGLRLWSRGVDTTLFRPVPGAGWGLPRPVFLHVGRVAVEKNIEAFLALDLPGSKVVVGDGPLLAALRQRHPGIRFAGALHGAALATAYAGADALVFPSRTDTFGLVMLEALACGIPVAAYPEDGPRNLLAGHPEIGALDEDLRAACLRALGADRAACRAHAERFSWDACAALFAAHLVPLRD